MHPVSSPPAPSYDPPAPVMGGMRWGRPLCGEDPFWTDYARRKRLNTDTPRRSAPPDIMAATPPAPPSFRITSAPPPEARAGEDYEYPARACDTDSNGFTWRLEQGPPGMSVDRYTGVVRWTPATGGRVEVTLSARTLHGRTAAQSWTICARKAIATRAPVPNARFTAALARRRTLRRPANSARPVCWCEGKSGKGGKGETGGKMPCRAVRLTPLPPWTWPWPRPWPEPGGVATMPLRR